MRVARLSLVFALIGFPLVPTSLAQVPDPAVATQAPQPGSGHHYIGLATETVSPSTGSLDFHLPISTPAGRQLSFPFGIRYSGPEQYSLSGAGAPNLGWQVGFPIPTTTNGWSYDLPVLTASAKVFYFWVTYTGPPPQGQINYQCDASQNYVFRGLDGAQYTLGGLGGQWDDPYYPPGSCHNNNPPVGPSNFHGIYATLPGSNTWTGWPNQPPVNVTDQSGNVYQFPGNSVCCQIVGPASPWALTAQTITDKNGNQISLSGPGSGNSYKDTLGRTIVAWTGLGNNGDQITVSGLSNPITLHWATISGTFPETARNVAGSTTCTLTPGGTFSATGMTEIDLPNGQKYTFTYDSTYGRLSKITFPGGGYVRYIWGLNPMSAALQLQWSASGATGFNTCTVEYDMPAITDRYVSYDGSTEVLHQHFSYSTAWDTQTAGIWDSKTTTVTSTDLLANQVINTIYTYSSLTPDTGGTYAMSGYFGLMSQIPVEKQIVYQDGSGHTLKTINKTWLNSYAMTGEQTILDNGQGTTKLYCYEANEQVTDVYEYGFQSEGAYPGDPSCQNSRGLNASALGPLRRHTATVYHNFVGASPSTHIVNAPDSTTVYDGSGNQVKQTTFTYDANSVVASGAQTGLASPPGLRGNVSTATHWLNTGGSSPVTSYTYFDTGQIQSITDPCGNTTCSDMTGSNHTTNYSYADSYASGTGTPPGQTNAYLTQVTHPNTGVAHIDKFTWGYNDGLIRSHIDQNNLTTNYTYNTPPSGCSFPDGLDRLSTVTYPDSGSTTYCYNDTPPSPTVTTTRKINSTQSVTSVSVSDGIGHTKQTQLTSDPQGIVYADTAFNGFGQVWKQSNPYRTGSDITTTTGTTIFAYDPLGRNLTTTSPDNSVLTTAYCGPSTLVTDPTNRWRRSRLDGLGFLVEVDEPNAVGATVASTGCPGTGEPIWVTSYGHDALGNLTSVLQNGSHSRSFAYDSLSRMTGSTNPEVGNITYTLDSNSNVATKKDARNITATYGYDVLNRETSRSYSNGDPTVTTVYDATNCLGLSPCQNIGYRTSMTDGAGSEAWAYQVDATNHRSVHVDQRTTASIVNGTPTNITKTATYYLDLTGNVTQVVYPTSRVVNYSYDNADRPSTAADASNGITYASGLDTSPGGTCLPDVTCYTPQGTFYALSIGETTSFTGLNLTHIYNNRLQPQEFKASSSGGNAIDITYSFVDPATNKNAGHVYGITNNLDSTRSQTFSYDQLNRLTAAQTTSTWSTSPAHCWGETYQYDGVTNGAWGNLTQIAATTNSAYTGCTQESGFTKTVDGNNHVSGFGYDASGNTTNDGVNTYTWDGESELKVTAGSTYIYDGDGRRVAKANTATPPVPYKLYWYGAGGEILAETDGAGNTNNSGFNDYIFFGGKRVAMITNGGNPTYYVEDLLGTSRVLTTNTGVVCYDADFYPFGVERNPYTDTCPQNNYKFEGKERDTETLNDDFGARYYSNRFGRWLSADWSPVPAPVPYANLTNPQTLNLYAMVSDDPESFADLDGHTPTEGTDPCNPSVESSAGDACQEQRRLDEKANEKKDVNQTTTQQQAQNQAQKRDSKDNQDDKNKDKKQDKEHNVPQPAEPKASMAAVGVVAIAGSELGPGDLLLIGGAVAAVLLAQNAKHNKEVMDGLAAQIQEHLTNLANNSQSPDPHGGWKREIRAALERMQRVGRRLGDKAMQKYKDIMDQASKALE